MRSAKLTLLLNVSSVGEMLQKMILEFEFALALPLAAKKPNKKLVGPAAEQSLQLPDMKKAGV